MFAEINDGGARAVRPALMLALLWVFISPWAEAQVQSLEIQPGDSIPNIEVTNNGSDYTAISSATLDLAVHFSAQCAARSRMDTYYLITNSTEGDFSNKEIAGTIGTGELGYMRLFRPQGTSSNLSKQTYTFKVPINELFTGGEPVPLKTCKELLKRMVQRGANKTSVLAKDMKIVQPISISLMPSCTAKNRTYWSKQTTTQLVNYVCKASKTAIAAEARRVAQEEKRKAAAEARAAKQVAAAKSKPKPEPKPKVEEKKPAPVVVAAARPIAPERKPEPPQETVTAQPQPVPAKQEQHAISEISVTAVPSEYSGDCPALIAFKGKITSAQKGLIKFHFENGGQAEATRAVMFKNKDHTQRFQTQTLFEKSTTGSVKLVVESPQARHAETGFKVVCRN